MFIFSALLSLLLNRGATLGTPVGAKLGIELCLLLAGDEDGAIEFLLEFRDLVESISLSSLN